MRDDHAEVCCWEEDLWAPHVSLPADESGKVHCESLNDRRHYIQNTLQVPQLDVSLQRAAMVVTSSNFMNKCITELGNYILCVML